MLPALHKRHRNFQRIEGRVQQDFAAGQVFARLALRAEAEIVVSVLVDFQPHLLNRLRQGIVQQARHRLEAVIHSNQDKNRRGDGLDIFPGNLWIGKDFGSGPGRTQSQFIKKQPGIGLKKPIPGCSNLPFRAGMECRL
jgi:hypothetical protein